EADLAGHADAVGGVAAGLGPGGVDQSELHGSLLSRSVGARSGDRAPRPTEGLLFGKPESFGRGRGTVRRPCPGRGAGGAKGHGPPFAAPGFVHTLSRSRPAAGAPVTAQPEGRLAVPLAKLFWPALGCFGAVLLAEADAPTAEEMSRLAALFWPMVGFFGALV